MAPQQTGPQDKPKHLVYKKVIKPLIEKKRRERINASLSHLKTLLLGDPKPGRKKSLPSRLDKAHILEMAVQRVEGLQRAASQDEGFSAGFTHCLSLIDTFLASQTQLGSALQPRLAEYLCKALQPMHDGNQGSVNQLQQGSAPRPQDGNQGSALRPLQTNNQGSALQLQQAENEGSALRPVHTNNQACAFLLTNTQDRALRPLQDVCQGTAPQLQQVKHQGSAHRCLQTKNLGTALQPLQARCQGSALRPLQEGAHGTALQPLQTNNQGSALRHLQTNNQGSALRPLQTNNQGIALRHLQTNNQGSALRPLQNNNQGSALRLLQAKYQDSALRPRPAQTLEKTQPSAVRGSHHMLLMHDKENIQPIQPRPWQGMDQTPGPSDLPAVGPSDQRVHRWKGARRLAFTPQGTETAGPSGATHSPIKKMDLNAPGPARDMLSQTLASESAMLSGVLQMGVGQGSSQCPSTEPVWRPW